MKHSFSFLISYFKIIKPVTCFTPDNTHIFSDFNTNSYGEFWDSRCEEFWVPAGVRVQKKRRPKLN